MGRNRLNCDLIDSYDYILPQRTQSLRKGHKENPVNLLILQILIQTIIPDNKTQKNFLIK
jgi:hypothetical protein